MTGSDKSRQRSYIIHGHFYQPPRENPWTNAIERQPSAAPAHDWNERVYSECYRPNGYSRVLDPNGMITEIHNNYEYLSFNFGPTLFSWLEEKHPAVAQRIIEADRKSAERLDGHGNALGQVYNHIIMPLSPRRDQLTQIRWAKSFFRQRFGRDCEGLWLAETAINMETVRCLVEEQIRFVILSPTQAESIRALDVAADEEWNSVVDGSIDTRVAYRVFPTNKEGQREEGHLDVFFFNEALSKDASFADLLEDAHTLAKRIVAACGDDGEDEERVAIIGTDGETFGHHRPYGDMCLAYLFSHAGEEHGLAPVNFGYFLEKNPPTHEVVLKNATGEGCAWSCAHGTGRWIRDCGCQTGGHGHWNQKWRTPLRDAFDSLRTRVEQEYKSFFRVSVPNPWALRDEYMSLGTNAKIPNEQIAEFVQDHGWHGEELTDEVLARIRRLLEAQKFMLYAYTSCGWFFADIGGIETVQNMRYAARAAELGINDMAARNEAIEKMLHILSRAQSNVGNRTGRMIFENEVLQQSRCLELLCYSAALDRLVRGNTTHEYWGFSVVLESWKEGRKKNAKAFRARIRNEATGEDGRYYVVVHHASSNFAGTVVSAQGRGPATVNEALSHPEAVKFTSRDVFSDFRDWLSEHFVVRVARNTLDRYFSWMAHNRKLLDSLAAMNMELPGFLQGPVAYLFTKRWNEVLDKLAQGGAEEKGFADFLTIHKDANRYGVTLDFAQSVEVLETVLRTEMNALRENLTLARCDRLRYLLNVVDRFDIPVPKSRLEDIFSEILENYVAQLHGRVTGNQPTTENDKTFLIRLLGFARRMNFSTDRFPLD